MIPGQQGSTHIPSSISLPGQVVPSGQLESRHVLFRVCIPSSQVTEQGPKSDHILYDGGTEMIIPKTCSFNIRKRHPYCTEYHSMHGEFMFKSKQFH